MEARSDILEIKFRSNEEFQFALLWEELYPNVDLYYEHPLYRPEQMKPGSKKRKQRPLEIDFYHKPSKTGIEIQGGTWVPGLGHSSGKGLQRDRLKAQIAAAQGILILPLSPEEALDREVLERTYLTILSRTSSSPEAGFDRIN